MEQDLFTAKEVMAIKDIINELERCAKQYESFKLSPEKAETLWKYVNDLECYLVECEK